jgi:hypothetical protein
MLLMFSHILTNVITTIKLLKMKEKMLFCVDDIKAIHYKNQNTCTVLSTGPKIRGFKANQG